jgi:uncharacterized protein YgiM (DUF1202 family)
VKTEVKREVPVEAFLATNSYVYKMPDEKSQKTWMLKKGTELTILAYSGEWAQVRDKEKRSGFVKNEVLTPNKP